MFRAYILIIIEKNFMTQFVENIKCLKSRIIIKFLTFKILFVSNKSYFKNLFYNPDLNFSLNFVLSHMLTHTKIHDIKNISYIKKIML